MRNLLQMIAVAGVVLGFAICIPSYGHTSQGGGYDITKDLWAKAVLKPPSGNVDLIWKVVGTDITPGGAQVISGYFYADPGDFAYGSLYNPELFVKIYIDPNGWCNIAFNHVTVDDVDVSTAHRYKDAADQTGTVTLKNRITEHQYTGVDIDSSLSTAGRPGTLYDGYLQAAAVSGDDGGSILSSELWARATLQVAGNPVTLVWKEVGSDITPSGDLVVSGYFYADPNEFAYGSVYNPEVFVKVYIASNGWANIAFNHVTVDDVAISSAHQFEGTVSHSGTISLTSRITEHTYNAVTIDTGPDFVTVEPANVSFTASNPTHAGSETIPPTGGTFTISEAGSPLNGFSMEVPALPLSANCHCRTLSQMMICIIDSYRLPKSSYGRTTH